jgi:hypothetical protein
MFLMGLLLGPALGLLAGDFTGRSTGGNRQYGVAAIAVIVLLVLFLPVIDFGLRLGLVTGFLLGLLLWSTPQILEQSE